ncbi:MAG: c-type cytochrome [Syntrophobacteraceae bacterium]
MLKKILVCAAILCFATSFVQLNGALGQDLEIGKILYQKSCMVCHGPKGDGKGRGAISLKLQLADFTKDKYWEHPKVDEKIEQTIQAGVKGKMRPYNYLSPEDVRSIVLYLNKIHKHQ